MHRHSIAQATGAEFAVLPPQNASGNWVKVVQRIPVRIAVKCQEGDPPLRVGMSTTIEIDTGHRRARRARAPRRPDRRPPCGGVGRSRSW